MDRRLFWFLLASLVVVVGFSGYEMARKNSGHRKIEYEKSKVKEFKNLFSSEEQERLKRSVRGRIVLGEKVNVNRATVEELDQVPGISRQIAENIVRYREEKGGIKSVRELLNIKGIKEKRLKYIEPYLDVE